MKKGQDAFERSLKEALEPYEVPYNSADWAQLEKQLDERKGPGWQSSAALYALLLGGSLAVATTVQLLATTSIADGAGHPQALAERREEPLHVAPSGTSSSSPGSLMHVKDSGLNGMVVLPDASAQRNRSSHGSAEALTTRTSATVKASNVNVAPLEATPTHTSPSGTEIAIRPSVTEGCPGTTVEFAVENMPQTGMHLWNFGDGSFSNKPAPSHTFSKAGTYEVMLSHSSMGGGTIQNKPASDLIVIHEAPEAAFNHLKQEYDNTVPSVHFENRSQGSKSYLWDFGDGTTSTVAHPDHVFKKKGIYSVSLAVTNAKGCVDKSEHEVRIDSDYNLLATRTFSPNGDAVEDLFMPDALKTLGVKFHMSIFDTKTGQLVYETSDATRPWNGRVANRGDICTPGDYMWMVEMKDGEKLGGTYTGSVSLLR